MNNIDDISIVLQIIILFATMMVGVFTFYLSHQFSRKNKVQMDSNKLFELEMERLKLQFHIREISDSLKTEENESVMDNRLVDVARLSTRLGEYLLLLSNVQLEMKHILSATESNYKSFTSSQCRLFAESWNHFLNFDKANFFWNEAIKKDEPNTNIKSETLRYYGSFLFNHGLKKAATNQFYESIKLSNLNNDCSKFINSVTYKTWVLEYYKYIINNKLDNKNFSVCIEEIGGIINQYELVVTSILHQEKRNQAMEGFIEVNRIIHALNHVAHNFNLPTLPTITIAR